MSALASLLYPALYVAAGTVIGATVLYYKNPTVYYKALLRVGLFYAGLKPKKLTLYNRVFSYAEKGTSRPDKPTFLFIHGFSSCKEAWCLTVKNLPADAHIICFDQAGHGDSSVHENDVLSFMGFVQRLYQFTQLMNLKSQPLHVIGQSLGGAVAGLFAATYPECVSHVSMLCPAGFTSPKTSKFAEDIANGKPWGLVPETPEELGEMMKMVSFRDAKIPTPILKGMLEARRERTPYFKKLLMELVGDAGGDILLDKAPTIKAPAQIIWGEKDMVLDVSGAELLRDKLPPGSRLDLVSKCGHVINAERPRHLAELLVDFQTSSANNAQSRVHSKM